MSVRPFPRALFHLLAALALTGGLLFAAGQSSLPVRAARRRIVANSIFVVNSSADAPDADQGDHLCASAAGSCTLRAAIMQANFDTGVDTVTLPSGIYTLTRPGDDDAAVLGDLDIVDDLTIQGAGSDTTIVNGNGAATGDRVFQILSSAKNASLSSLTLRSGQKISNTFDEGGGLYWDGNGSHLSLHDVVLENNQARYAGGFYLNYSGLGDVVNMDHVVVRGNVATTGAAGGLGVNFGDLATFDLRDSQIVSNAAYEAGGLYFQGTPAFGLQAIRLERDVIYSNTASLSGGFENHSGTTAVPIALVNSRLHDNHADFYGGAIGNYGTLVISGTMIEANSASITGTNSTNTRGGGVYDYEGGRITLVQSTLSGNSAASGGGIYSELFLHNNAALTLTDSTLSNNTASRDGGGLYAQGGQIKLLNATIADNRVVVPINIGYGALGGGIYITGSAIITAQNALLGDNTHRYGINLPKPDDCLVILTSLHSLGNNLIEAVNNCNISGTTIGNITGQDPQLGLLQNNGGSTLTQAPQAGSPAIDHGDNTACPPIDQRGFGRPLDGNHDGTTVCDIGAIEAGLPVYLPLIRR